MHMTKYNNILKKQTSTDLLKGNAELSNYFNLFLYFTQFIISKCIS